jgi:hypothetical protein
MISAFVKVRPADAPGMASPRITRDLVRLFALDRQPVDHRPPPVRRPLLCRWQRDADGRLTCIWEPDIAPASRG